MFQLLPILVPLLELVVYVKGDHAYVACKLFHFCWGGGDIHHILHHSLSIRVCLNLLHCTWFSFSFVVSRTEELLNKIDLQHPSDSILGSGREYFIADPPMSCKSPPLNYIFDNLNWFLHILNFHMHCNGWITQFELAMTVFCPFISLKRGKGLLTNRCIKKLIIISITCLCSNQSGWGL